MAATLTSVAIKVRRIIRYGIYFIIFATIARFVFLSGYRYYISHRPEKPLPPTLGFDILPAIPFSEQVAELPRLEYNLETTTGALPEITETTMKVFYIPKPVPTLGSVDSAKKKALSLGFDDNPIEVSQTIYRFNHKSKPSTLEMNIVTGSFSIAFNLAADPSPIQTRPPTVEECISQAQSILSSASSLPPDLTGNHTHEFLKVEGLNLVSALSFSEASLVKVNLFRKSFGDNQEYPSLTKSPKESNVWFIIGGNKQVVGAEFHYQTLDETRFETYPVKTVQEAYDELINGKAHVANLGLNKEGKIIIRKAYLAYYDPDNTTQFYQPVYVFEGDGEFVAYVPAVTPDYYSQSATD